MGLPDTALVLVAVMPAPKDQEIARLFGWYRIPLRMAPKLINVDYLLFYQTTKFPAGHQSMIETYAEVKGHELTTRQDLLRNEPDHPRAKEEYYKIDIGPLMTLQSPINSGRWTRINFFYSLGRLVNQARIINDLIVRADDREILWKTIREKNAQEYAGREKSRSVIRDNEIGQLLDLIIELNSDGNSLKPFSNGNLFEQA